MSVLHPEVYWIEFTKSKNHETYDENHQKVFSPLSLRQKKILHIEY